MKSFIIGDVNEKDLQKSYEKYQAMNLNLTMTRGVPCVEQLNLSNPMLTILDENSDFTVEGIGDARNYGGLLGTKESRQLFAEIFEADTEEVAVVNNASLNIMYDLILKAMIFGVVGSEKSWGKYERIKFLCPSPGYDRHFSICEKIGIEMITVKMLADGPDMEQVKMLAENDETIKGIWCVPKYSNPDGVVYSDEVVRKFAALSPAAKDFRIFWDNAYAVHDLVDESDRLLNIFEELKKVNKENMIYMFTSTSKITFPGSGISAVCASKENIKYISEQMFVQTIGPDKINQLRHVKFLKDLDGVREHMKKHREIIKPKFDIVDEVLSANFNRCEEINWTKPNGGYFVSLNVPKGCAKRTVELADKAGVALTPAGSTFPYKKDIDDRNIRISPTFPPIEDLRTAMNVLAVCVKIAITMIR